MIILLLLLLPAGTQTETSVRNWLKACTYYFYQEEYVTSDDKIYLSQAAAAVLGGWLLAEQDGETRRAFYFAIRGAEVKEYDSKPKAQDFVAGLLQEQPVTANIQVSRV